MTHQRMLTSAPFPSCLSLTHTHSLVDSTQFQITEDGPVNWMVNIAEYQNVQLGIKDATGNEIYSDDMTVKTNNFGKCVGLAPQINAVNAKCVSTVEFVVS